MKSLYKATYSSSNKSCELQWQIKAVVKGRKEPISIYVPKSLLVDDLTKSDIPVSIGRKTMAFIQCFLMQHKETGMSDFVKSSTKRLFAHILKLVLYGLLQLLLSAHC